MTRLKRRRSSSYPTLEEIESITLEVLGISEENFIMDKYSRKRCIIDAKHILSLISQEFGYSQYEIGDFLDMNHSSICYHGKKAKDYEKYDKEFSKIIQTVREKVSELDEYYGEKLLTGYIARDKNEELHFFLNKKPIMEEDKWESDYISYSLPTFLFPNISWDKSLKECELSIKLI